MNVLRRALARLRPAVTVVLAAASVSAARAQPNTVVMAGSDYFRTDPGTFAVLPGIGPVSLIGNPIGPGDTDTIVRRLADADLASGTATIPLEISALSLMSDAPLNIGGSFFDIFVTLNPAPGHNQGMMTVRGNETGGHFDSFFDVFFDVRLEDVANPANQTIIPGIDLGALSGNGNPWSSTPDPATLLIPGPYPGSAANWHTPAPNGYVDFFTTRIIEDKPGGGARHIVRPSTPEPSSLMLVFSSLLVLGASRARRR